MYGSHRDLPVLTPSCPPGRSADLPGGSPRSSSGGRRAAARPPSPACWRRRRTWSFEPLSAVFSGVADLRKVFERARPRRLAGRGTLRSEEHTAELQSLMRISYAVSCFKQKNIQQKQPSILT